MAVFRRYILAFAGLSLAMLWADVAPASIFTPASLANPFDSFGANPQNRGFRVRQQLPVGDMMTAVLTAEGVVIMNGDGSTPTYGATVGAGTMGVSFDVPGIVNGLVVTDITQTHTAPGIPDGILQLAPFRLGGGMQGLGNFLGSRGFGVDDPIAVPDFRDSSFAQDLYYGVDLTIWADSGPPAFSLGQTFSVVNGISSLPGILFSTTPLDAGVNSWTTAASFTGEVVIDSLHDFASVPEPSSMALGALGLLGLGLARIYPRRGSR